MVTAALAVDWNTPEMLRRAIQSSRRFDPHLRWVVFKNHHPDHPQVPDDVETIVWPTNVGHGAGINHAARRAWDLWRPDWFFVVNPDVVWIEPVVSKMEAFLSARPDVFAVGPKQVDSKWRITAAGIFGTNERPQHRFWHRHDPKNVLARDLVESVTLAGSAFLCDAVDFFGFGGMLESHHYYSETWLMYHARAHGKKVFYWGEPVMIHEWHQSSPIGYPGTDGKMAEDRELFRRMCDEHDPPIARD